MKTITVSTAYLTGAALDWAVAVAVEVWKDAHEWFPTMTLDPSFSGVQPMVYSDGQAACQLIPNNPFRQDYQIYHPSTGWSQGGPLIPKYMMMVDVFEGTTEAKATGVYEGCAAAHWTCFGATPLIAICRAVVGVHFGQTVDVPEVLV